MQITSVTVHHHRSLVPVKGWDAVRSALTAFERGHAEGSRETSRIQGDAIGQATGPMGLGLFLLGSVKAAERSSIVDDLLNEARPAVDARKEFSKHYDYDGMGTAFFKTSVTIKALGDDMYGVGLYAAYVGDRPEEGLADHLGIPRAIISCIVEVETVPIEGDRFEFDFEHVLRKLDPVLEKRISGRQVVKAMMPKKVFDITLPFFTLGTRDGLSVGIETGRVERRIMYDVRSHRDIDTWSARGSVLSGRLARDYESDDKSAKATPTFRIVVRSAEFFVVGSHVCSKPMWHPEEQQRAIALAETIAATLK